MLETNARVVSSNTAALQCMWFYNWVEDHKVKWANRLIRMAIGWVWCSGIFYGLPMWDHATSQLCYWFQTMKWAKWKNYTSSDESLPGGPLFSFRSMVSYTTISLNAYKLCQRCNSDTSPCPCFMLQLIAQYGTFLAVLVNLLWNCSFSSYRLLIVWSC